MQSSGLVYVLQTPYGMKIGKTKNIDQRMKALSEQYEVVFVHAVSTHDISNLERTLHQHFIRKRVLDAPSREIFALSINDLYFIQSFVRFRGRPCKHFTSLTDAVRHSMAVLRRYRSTHYGR